MIDDDDSLPSGFLADEEIRVVNAKADLVPTLAKVSVTQGCKSGQEKRTRRWQMRNSESDVGYRHLR